MTYSIVARDPGSGELGVAVQSRWFSVGSVVTWAEAGVGAVATQSFAEPAYGPRLLDALRDGRAPEEALATLLDEDEAAAVRQVAVVDTAGRTAAHTGSGCLQPAGHVGGEGVSVQANMMERATVWPAMLAAFEAAEGPLAERLVAALAAGEGEGGDVRGRQSAALLVVSGDRETPPWRGRLELRVEDHHAPVAELARVLAVHRAYDALDAAFQLIEAGDGAGALARIVAARELAPDDDQLQVMHAIGLAGAGRPEEAAPVAAGALAVEPRWRAWVTAMEAAGHLPPGSSAVF